MGIDVDVVAAFGLARAMGADFTDTVMLGSQTWFMRPGHLAAALQPFGYDVSPEGAAAIIAGPPGADGVERPATVGMFEFFGATSVDAIDASDFEGATVVHDLNTPVPSDLHGRFSFVFDGGTLEHVFDVRTSIENVMKLVAPGGTVISVVPANNQIGHGFYQFSPELYFRAFCPENGFEVQYVLIKEFSLRSQWYRITDPAEMGHRLTLSTLGEANMYLIARRIGEPGLAVLPQQSDYAVRWDEHDRTGEGGSEAPPPPSRARALLARLPLGADAKRRLLRTGQQLKILRGSVVGAAGVRQVDLAELAAKHRSRSRT